MDVYSTEEEQIEAIKRWWKKNGNSILTALTIALLVIFGWRIWQDNAREQIESASADFQDLLDASQKLAASQDAIKDDSIEAKSVDTFAQKVLDKHSDKQYALHAKLMVAKKAVLLQQYDVAERELKDIIRSKPVEALLDLARYRLAKVLLAKGSLDEAMLTLDAGEPGAFASAYEELRGDIALQKGDKALARNHYKNAMNINQAADEAEQLANPMLEMKYFDLAETDK